MTKLTWVLALVASLGWGAAFYLWKRPVPQPQTIVQTVDKVQIETKYRVITKPNGVVIKEQIVTKQDIKHVNKTKLTPIPKAQWMLGAHMRPSLSGQHVYGGDVGYRIKESPVWIRTGFNSRQELTLGISIEF